MSPAAAVPKARAAVAPVAGPAPPGLSTWQPGMSQMFMRASMGVLTDGCSEALGGPFVDLSRVASAPNLIVTILPHV